jgi:tRNA pseudouridine38-40 synthase
LVFDEGLKDRTNAILPPAVKIFGIPFKNYSYRFQALHRALGQFNAKNAIDYRIYEYIFPTWGFAQIVKGFSLFLQYLRFLGSNAVFDKEILDRINQLLKLYEGTHNFHNFTVGKKATEPSAYRFMQEVKVRNFFENSLLNY